MPKRDEILKAAMSCFTAYGYSKTTMSDIGRKVGINKASLYYHFKDKLALYEAVVQNMKSAHVLKVKPQIDSLSQIQDKIICLVTNYIDFWGNIAINYLSTRTGYEEGKQETESVFNSIMNEDIKNIQNMIDEGISNDIFVSCDSAAVAVQITKVTQGLLLIDCPLNLPDEQKLEGYENVKNSVREVLRLLLKGIEK